MTRQGIGRVEQDLRAVDLLSDEVEARYLKHYELPKRRKDGQFFTPFSIASFMSQWLHGVAAANPRILDPCAGLGVFARAVRATDDRFATRAQFALWEKDPALCDSLRQVCEKLAIRCSVTNKDFLDEHGWSAVYDAVIANPPYYKHHFVKNKEDLRRAVCSEVGASFSLQTNVYCWFLIKSLALLKRGGRLAFIVPSEFLNANYGQAIKKWVLAHGSLRHLISVSYKNNAFGDVLTTTCILLAEHSSDKTGVIRFHRAESAAQLTDLTEFLARSRHVEYTPGDLDPRRKWRAYFRGAPALASRKAGAVPVSVYGRFSRGIATGANAFFALSRSQANALGLPTGCLVPCISKARQAPDKRFAGADFDALVKADKPVFLFDAGADQGEAIERYLRSGEAAGYHLRYLTRSRRPWYALEKRLPGRIWAGVFGREGLRFVWNDSDCLSLTCYHTFQPAGRNAAFVPILFLYFHSSIGRRFLEQEKREYGGGLDKYEPNDLNQVLAPDFRRIAPPVSTRLLDLHRIFIAASASSAKEAAALLEADSIFCSLLADR